MRIGGIASGMDTEQMVRDLMRAERMRLDRMFQQEQRIKWRQEAYNDINRKMANFIVDSRNNFGLTRTTSTGVALPSSANGFNWVKSATSSNESAVRTTANANAMEGTHEVEVKQLAEVASVTSENLEDLLESDGLTFREGISHEFTIETRAGKKKFEIGEGSDIKNMNQLVRAINNATDDSDNTSLGLRAAYDKDLGKLMINTRETGYQQYIEIHTIGETTPESEKFVFTAKNEEGIMAPVENGERVRGKNSEILFNGDELQRPTNNFSVYGINLQLQEVTTAPIVIRVANDVDSIFDQVKSFVDEYNKLLDDINGQTGEKYYRDFPPLTNEQKESMTDKDIELWEEKARSGLLRNDSTLTRTTQNIRGNLYEDLEGGSGSYNHITQIGITTGSYQDRGKLVINEEKLRAAISNDPEGVIDLLFKEPDKTLEGKDRTKSSGLVHRIYDGLTEGMQDIIRQSGPGEDSALLRNVRATILTDFVTKGSQSVLDKDLNNLSTRIMREEDMLRRKEDRYWQRFTAMEKALSEMQQQSMWLMSQMGMA